MWLPLDLRPSQATPTDEIPAPEDTRACRPHCWSNKPGSLIHPWCLVADPALASNAPDVLRAVFRVSKQLHEQGRGPVVKEVNRGVSESEPGISPACLPSYRYTHVVGNHQMRNLRPGPGKPPCPSSNRAAAVTSDAHGNPETRFSRRVGQIRPRHRPSHGRGAHRSRNDPQAASETTRLAADLAAFWSRLYRSLPPHHSVQESTYTPTSRGKRTSEAHH